MCNSSVSGQHYAVQVLKNTRNHGLLLCKLTDGGALIRSAAGSRQAGAARRCPWCPCAPPSHPRAAATPTTTACTRPCATSCPGRCRYRSSRPLVRFLRIPIFVQIQIMWEWVWNTLQCDFKVWMQDLARYLQRYLTLYKVPTLAKVKGVRHTLVQDLNSLLRGR